jgi:hypothetical protein
MRFPPASSSLLAAGAATGVHASYGAPRAPRKMLAALVHKNFWLSTAFRRIPQKTGARAPRAARERDEAA